MKALSTGNAVGGPRPRSQISSHLAGMLAGMMSGPSGRLGRIAMHPIGASLCLALGYMVLCGAYIMFSGRIAANAALSISQLRTFELLKGLSFVTLTGLAYFGFAAFLLRRIALQQRHLALVFQGVSDSLFLLLLEGTGGYRFLCVNAAFLALTGRARDQVVGRRIEEVLPSGSLGAFVGKCQEAIQGRRTVRWEGRSAFPAGSGVFEVVLSPLADAPCTRLQIAGIIRDVTERRSAEDEVRELSAYLLHSQDEERRRIGRELHDSTAQELAVVSMNLGLLQDRGAGHDVAADNLLTDSQAVIEHCQRELRTLSYQLHPPVLDEAGLAGAVQEYAEGFAQRSGITVTLDARQDLGRLPVETERALFRVVQESLSNVHRHSGSPSAAIRIAREGTQIIVEVSDHGHGLRIRGDGTVAKVGVGLAGMRERVRQLGGRFEIASSARGTTVRAMVPGEAETDEDPAHSDCR